MAGKTNERKPNKSGLTVLFEKEEKQMIRRAALETDKRSAGEFIREAAVRAARKALAA